PDGRADGPPDRRRDRRARPGSGDARGARPRQAAAPHGAGEGAEDRQRQGEPARLLRGGPGRLPQALRPRGRVGCGHRGGRAARDEHLSRAAEAHTGRAGADRRGWEMTRTGSGRGAFRVAPRAVPVWILLVVAAVVLGRPLAAHAADVKLPPVTGVTLENGPRLRVPHLDAVPVR